MIPARKFVAEFCTMLILCSVITLAQSTATNTVPAMQQKLSTLRGEVDQLLATQTNIFDQLDKVEAELELSSRLQRELRQQSRTIGGEIEATKDTVAVLRQQSSVGGVALGAHLRAYYKQPLPDERFVPFAASDDNNYGNQDYLLQRLIASDKRRLITLNSDLVSNQQLLANLKLRQDGLAKVLQAQAVEETKSRQAIAQRDRLLAQVRGRQRQKVRQMEELNSSSEVIGDIFAQIESERSKTVDAVWQREHELALRLRGRLEWPVHGSVTTGFGLKRDDDNLLTKNNGVDIATHPGRKVVAAATGEVLYIGWARGLERFVVVDHGGSIYSLYGNLDQVAVSEGDQVIRGERFASAASAQVHFEIRDGKTAVDPTVWLRK